jgi:hypothetical protein
MTSPVPPKHALQRLTSDREFVDASSTPLHSCRFKLLLLLSTTTSVSRHALTAKASTGFEQHTTFIL